jgi:hypothetical protein
MVEQRATLVPAHVIAGVPWHSSTGQLHPSCVLQSAEAVSVAQSSTTPWHF